MEYHTLECTICLASRHAQGTWGVFFIPPNCGAFYLPDRVAVGALFPGIPSSHVPAPALQLAARARAHYEEQQRARPEDILRRALTEQCMFWDSGRAPKVTFLNTTAYTDIAHVRYIVPVSFQQKTWFVLFRTGHGLWVQNARYSYLSLLPSEQGLFPEIMGVSPQEFPFPNDHMAQIIVGTVPLTARHGSGRRRPQTSSPRTIK